jgi:multiple antibiotic resistance protein
MNLLQVFITILCVLNPIGGMNLYSSVVGEDKSNGIRVLIISFLCISCSLILLAAVAQPLLDLFGFPLYAIHFGGGVLLVIIGVLNMLKVPDKKPVVENTTASDKSNKNSIDGLWLGINPISLASFSPAVIIVDINYSFMAQSISDKLGLVIVLLLVSLTFCGLLMNARRIKNKFSAGGMLFLTRIIGLLITAVAFQMIVSGVVSIVPLVLGDSLNRI